LLVARTCNQKPATSNQHAALRAERIWYEERMDRRLASKNLRTGLIAGAISLIVFAAAFITAWVY
jgi:fatty acid desaturase